MTSFLHRVFRYRASADRTPLEDFLSEVLVDFLNRAPTEEANAFISNCFVPADLRDNYRTIIGNGRAIARTQIRIEFNRCLDILIEYADRPLIIIENKLWAAFQSHQRIPIGRTDTADEDGVIASSIEDKEVKYDHQLETYGRWLGGREKPGNWPGVLCVLTHISQPPNDFIPSNIQQYGSVPYLQFWRSVHGELNRLVGTSSDQTNLVAWKFVGQELAAFLGENAMDSSDLKSVEISSLNISMAPLRKIDSIFSEVGAELLQRFPGTFVRRGQSSRFELQHSRVWGWTYFNKPEKMYIGYGIYFSPIEGEFATAVPPISDQEHAFLIVGSEGHAMDRGGDGPPAGWSGVGEETWFFLKPFPLSTRQNEERFPQFIVRLIQENFAEVIGILETDLRIHLSKAETPS